MDRAGRQLTKSCVDALVAAGEVSQQEVERRKKGGRKVSGLTRSRGYLAREPDRRLCSGFESTQAFLRLVAIFLSPLGQLKGAASSLMA
jgi:hypothetical protein